MAPLLMFSQENGQAIFDDQIMHEIRVNFEQEQFWDSLEYYYSQFLDLGEDKQYMMVQVEIDGTIVDSIGIREKGFFSNWGAFGSRKKPLKIDFNEYVSGKKYDGLKKLNLQNGFADPTSMRDIMAYKFMRLSGIPAPRASFVRLYLNDEYWGVYIAVEQIDNKFLKNHFSDNDGNLFKCINNTSFTWQGENSIDYKDEFGLKTNKTEDDWSGFIELARTINSDQSEFDSDIESKINLDGFLKVLAADVLMNNWDSYYEHGRNFYIYEDPESGLFQWLPWDYNLSFDVNDQPIEIEYDNSEMTESKPLVVGVMNNDSFKEIYFTHMCTLINDNFNLESLEGDIDYFKNLIRSDLDTDPNKFYSIENFDTAIEENLFDEFSGLDIRGLKPFFATRSEVVLNEFNNFSFDCNDNISSVEEGNGSDIQLFPNPAKDQIRIQTNECIGQIEIVNLLGEQVRHFENVCSETELDLSGLSTGMFVLQLKNETWSKSIKFVKE